jgi:hypothetical protein
MVMKARCLPLLGVLAALAGCAPQVEGEYRDAGGAVVFRLANGKYLKTNPDGTLYKHARPGHAPLPVASPYKIDGKVVRVDSLPDRAQFDILPNGRLKSAHDGHELIFVRK